MSDAIVAISWCEEAGGLPAGAEELLTVAKGLADKTGSPLHWLLLGPLADGAEEAAGRYGVASLHHLDDDKLASFSADAAVAALAAYAGERSPKALLFHQTLDARVVAPRLAGRLGSAVVMNGVSIEPGGDGFEVTATAYGGDTRCVYAIGGRAPIVSFGANAVVPAPGDGAPVGAEPVSADLSGVEERITVVEEARLDGPRLDDAEIIVSGGRGLGKAENYKLIEELAAALGGLAGASRPIVDDGWVDSAHQVGLTGRITRPNLYIAVGISGASQHMAGCSAAKTLVAINRDEDAAIFRHARYGIVGDCLELLPELIKAAAAR